MGVRLGGKWRVRGRRCGRGCVDSMSGLPLATIEYGTGAYES